MSRFSSTISTSASAEATLAYRQLVDVTVSSGDTLYLITGNQFVYTLGNTYSPVGGLGGIEPIEEDTEPQPRTVRLWLSAVDSASLFAPLQEDMFGRAVVIRHCYLNPSDWTTVTTPDTLWTGAINKVEVRFADTERGNFYEIEAETTLRRNALVNNFNRETHWVGMGYSGDLFFNYIDQIPLSRTLWGQRPTGYGGGGGGIVPNPVAPGKDFYEER